MRMEKWLLNSIWCRQSIFVPRHENTSLVGLIRRGRTVFKGWGLQSSPDACWQCSLRRGLKALAPLRTSRVINIRLLRMRINLEFTRSVGSVLFCSVLPLPLLWICINKYRLEKSIYPRVVLKCRLHWFKYYSHIIRKEREVRYMSIIHIVNARREIRLEQRSLSLWIPSKHFRGVGWGGGGGGGGGGVEATSPLRPDDERGFACFFLWIVLYLPAGDF